MSRKMYFISGLPRSGSTLLSALLSQNPRIKSGIISPVGSMCNSLLNIMGAKGEFATVFTEKQKNQMLTGVFRSYYDEVDDEVDMVFDNNRSWTGKLHILNQLFDDVKVVCCVRDISWIMDSFERLFHKHPLTHSKMFENDRERQTVYTRSEALTGDSRIVGYSISALKAACYGLYASSLLLVDYEILAKFPQKTMDLVYDFIGEESFENDINNLDFKEEEFDAGVGIPGLHTIRKEVSFQERKTILPPDLFDRYQGGAFWNNLGDSGAHIINLRSKEEV